MKVFQKVGVVSQPPPHPPKASNVNKLSYSQKVTSTRSVRKVSDRIFLCEHLMDYNLVRLHEPTLNLSAHA